MKGLHKVVHAFDTVRSFNGVVGTKDSCVALLSSENISGSSLEDSIEDLKLMIAENTTWLQSRYVDIQTYINGCDSYNLTTYTNKAQYQVLEDKITSDTFAQGLAAEIQKPQYSTKEKLAAIRDFQNTTQYATPITLETPYHYAIMLNDWLDASSHTLRGFSHRTGEPSELDDKQSREMVKGMLNQFPNLLGITYPVKLQGDIDLMTDTRDAVLEKIDAFALAELAKIIDNDIERLPLMRRLWDIN